MTGRPGLFGGFRQSGTLEFEDAELIGGSAPLDPIWGSLGAPNATAEDSWGLAMDDPDGGPIVEIEVFGNGFQMAGKIRTGTFGRVSDWLNMQTGFIQLHEASVTHLGHANLPDPEHQHGTMWIRMDQIVLVAERATGLASGASGMVVQKQKRQATIVVPGYSLRGSLHVHAYGSIRQFLDTPDPKFIPITDVLLRWTDDPAVMARYPVAMINRSQLVSLLEEAATPEGATGAADGRMFRREAGAA